MRKVKCYECGRVYDFDREDFCPKCGAFNQPKKQVQVGTDGSLVRSQEPVIRRDGINERNHAGSFVHRELHQENRARRGTALTKHTRRKPAAFSAPKPKTSSAEDAWKKDKARGDFQNVVKPIWWAVFIFIALRALLSAIF